MQVGTGTVAKLAQHLRLKRSEPCTTTNYPASKAPISSSFVVWLLQTQSKILRILTKLEQTMRFLLVLVICSQVGYMSGTIKQYSLPIASGSSQERHVGKYGSEEKFTEVHNPGMSVDSGRYVADPGLNLNYYSFKAVWLTVDKIADPPNASRDVHADHCSSLMQSF